MAANGSITKLLEWWLVKMKPTFGDFLELLQDGEEPLGEGRRLRVQEDLQVVMHLLLRLLVGHHHHDVLWKQKRWLNKQLVIRFSS